MDDRVRIACLGAGYFAQLHFNAWRRNPQARLVGVADRDIAKAQRTGLPAFADLGQMLEQTRPDLLDLIVPPAAQAGAVRQAIKAGTGAVIWQRPAPSPRRPRRRA